MNPTSPKKEAELSLTHHSHVTCMMTAMWKSPRRGFSPWTCRL